MPQKIKFKKQYKSIKFGDGPDPDTLEGHRNRMAEAAEKRAYTDCTTIALICMWISRVLFVHF